MGKVVIDTSGLDAIMGGLQSNKEAALQEIGDRVVKRAQELVPVDSGNLQRSIHAEVDGDTLNIAADADYASYVELGTSKMAAQPYLGPALLEVRKDIPKIIGKALIGGVVRKLKRIFR